MLRYHVKVNEEPAGKPGDVDRHERHGSYEGANGVGGALNPGSLLQKLPFQLRNSVDVLLFGGQRPL